MRDVLRRADDPVFSSSARRLAKRASAKRRKMSPRTGVEYWPAFSPELARNWSAAAQRRFSSVWLAVSFSVGATQRMLPPKLDSCSLDPHDRRKSDWKFPVAAGLLEFSGGPSHFR